jgi:sugar lactone lactonase YvrE
MRRVGTHTDILGEGPVWCDRSQALYWVDIRAPAVRRHDLAAGATATSPTPELVGSLAVCESGRLLVALSTALAIFDPATGGLERVAEIAGGPDQRFNDGKCDRQGRFWVGTMNNVTRAPEGSLLCLKDRELRTVVAGGIRIPNSLAWSPDNRTMYFADSLSQTIRAYPFDPVSGRLGAGRDFARVAPPAIPDGATVDAEGFLWSAEYDGWRLTRYAPDGRVDRHVALPVRRPTSCAFGGPDLDVLFVTTATQKLTPEELAEQPLAGALLALDVGAKGLPEPRFRDHPD